ncbi:hypothetical protein [Amycolatopsis taiwanensis]|nr:hypothetical protein [Amycolatopsis taiwanensis]
MASQVHIKDAPLNIQLREDKSLPLICSDGVTPYDLVAEFKAAWDSGALSYEPDKEHAFPVEGTLLLAGLRPSGEVQLCETKSIKVTYTVERATYLGQLKPLDYRGLIDHLDNQNFLPSYLAMEFPPLESDTWTKITHPDRLAINVAGFFITAEDARISTAQYENLNFRYLGP